MTKKKWIVSGILLAICVAAGIWIFVMFLPRPIIRGPYSFAYDIVRTTHRDGATISVGTTFQRHDDDYVLISRVEYRGEDVTEKFDHDALVELLAGTMSRRSRTQSGFLASDVLWQVSVIHGGNSQDIILSRKDATRELNVWYSPGRPRRTIHVGAYRWMHTILDPAALKDALEEMKER
ncbi:MAG: hypothetical protein FWC93_07630 [Defluviitaleaceae bacterium]|nr:hypothetical protein [Defluviitaleaceae bacterium]